jgi:hypothetical protein
MVNLKGRSVDKLQEGEQARLKTSCVLKGNECSRRMQTQDSQRLNLLRGLLSLRIKQPNDYTGLKIHYAASPLLVITNSVSL